MRSLKLRCKKPKKICANDERHKKVWKIILEYVEKRFMNLGEPITFDNIQICFCINICLVVLYEMYNGIVIARSFLPPVVRWSKNTLHHAYNITTGTTFIIRNTGRVNCPSCTAEATVLNHFKSVTLCFV